MNILIIGSSGFIAKYFLDYLRKGNNKIIGIDIIKSINTTILYDVRTKIILDSLPNKVDLIVNLAAIHREPGHNLEEYFHTNLLGAENVCDLAEKLSCNRIIFTSSISPYGSSDELKDEYSVPCPSTAYGSSKLAAEKIHISWQNRDKNKRILTIVRPGVVFGKGEHGNMSRLVKLIHKNLFFYMGNKNICKAGIYVKELINQTIWVHEKQIKKKFSKIIVFNATMWPNPSIHNYVTSIKELSNIKSYILNIPFLFFLIPGYFFDLLFKFLGKQNNLSPIRLRKLISPNKIKPSFLLINNYKFLYTLHSALADWKKEDPEIWS